MAWTALTLYLIWLIAAFGAKSLAMRRRVGFSGFHGMSGNEGPAARFAGVLIIAGSIGAFVAPVLELTGTIQPFEFLEADWIGWVGLAIAVSGALISFMAQAGMGDSWRIGVEAGEETKLVTGGFFSVCRNPFFGAVFVLALGLFLMVPNPVALVAGLGLFLGFEIQVRVIEEPNLKQVFGGEYEEYGRRVGRFLPGLGRLR